MTMLATRIRHLSDLEGFDVQVLDDEGKIVDVRQNGFAVYDYQNMMKGSATVSEWKTKRFYATYPGYECRVLRGDGSVAPGQVKLSTVRESY